MFAPKLYKIRKIPLRNILIADFDLILTKEQENMFLINEADNLLFRQIRLITCNIDDYIPYVVFIDAKGFGNNTAQLEKVLKQGFKLNNTHFVIGERSASMARMSILSFIDSGIKEELNERISMGLNIKSTVISKYQAYRGLLMSSCHVLEGYLPYIVIVPDYETVIKEQMITYVIDTEKEYRDKATNELKLWREKGVKTRQGA